MTDSSSRNEPRSNRRDFLKGKSARNALQSFDSTRVASNENPLSSKFVPDSEPVSAFQRRANYLEQYSKNAMACEFEIFFNLHQYRQSGACVAAAFQLIDKIEDQMTVYRTESEVSHINRTAAEHPIATEPQLFGLLKQALEIHNQTAGAFDITSAALTKLWRFDRRTGTVPSSEEIKNILQNVGNQKLILDSERGTIFFKQHGIEINLGGIGKGHALDRVAIEFQNAGIVDFMIHGGQSSVVAHGQSTEISNDTNSDNEHNSEMVENGWRIGLSHPTLPGVRLAEITLRNQALGTSGTGRQGFFHHGQRYGHIIDPRTGWPSSHFLSTTVITDSAARADALATAFFVMPIEDIESYCQRYPEVGAILVTKAHPSESNARKKCLPGQLAIQTLNLDPTVIQFMGVS